MPLAHAVPAHTRKASRVLAKLFIVVLLDEVIIWQVRVNPVNTVDLFRLADRKGPRADPNIIGARRQRNKRLRRRRCVAAKKDLKTEGRAHTTMLRPDMPASLPSLLCHLLSFIIYLLLFLVKTKYKKGLCLIEDVAPSARLTMAKHKGRDHAIIHANQNV
jgi:hypothetical protein